MVFSRLHALQNEYKINYIAQGFYDASGNFNLVCYFSFICYSLTDFFLV